MNEKYMEILQQYDLELLSARKGRGAWLCETDRGLKLVKEYRGTVRRLEFEDEVLGFIGENSRIPVDRCVRNREDGLLSPAGDGTKYIVKEWFSDRECSLKDTREVLQAAERIGELHGLLRKLPFKEEWTMGSILGESLAGEMERHNQELKRARNFIRGKRRKTGFELRVIAGFDRFYEQAREAAEGMERIFSKEGSRSLFLCHGDLDQHHLLMTGQGIGLIEFNRMHRGVQVTDLYHFLRKVMEKHDWNSALGISVLDVYERILPLTDQERKCLYYLFLYPEKYWKQINFYYNGNKAWIPERNGEKLEKLEEQEEKRRFFLQRIGG